MLKRRTFSWSVCCVLVAGAITAEAQGPATFPVAPKPDQVLHVLTTQEFSIAISSGAPSVPGGQQMLTKSVLGFTQSNGRFDKDRMEARITIDRFESAQTIKGTTKSPANIEKVIGRSLTIVLDTLGKLVDVNVPGDMQDVSIVLRQLMGSTYTSLNVLPAKTMRIGESVTVPSTIPVRVPGSNRTAPYETRAVMTLRAIDTGGSHRIARFDQRIESAEESGPLKLSGGGTIDFNLDRGFVAASTTEWTFSGNYADPGGTGAGQSIGATLKVTVTGKE